MDSRAIPVHTGDPRFVRIFFNSKSQFKDDIRYDWTNIDLELCNRLFDEALRYQGEEGTLSNKGILQKLISGEIEIEPFHLSALAVNSYDVTLGRHYYRMKKPNTANQVHNIYSKTAVNDLWQLEEAELYSDYRARTGMSLEGVADTDRIICSHPHELILGHTNEKCGGRVGFTSKMYARSSTGRSGIAVCGDAGLGDQGFSRSAWTMELKNSTPYVIPLVVGRRIAQIQFLAVTETFQQDGFRSYIDQGKYHSCEKAGDGSVGKWLPTAMLPRLNQDTYYM